MENCDLCYFCDCASCHVGCAGNVFTVNFVWAIFSMLICQLISGYFVCSIRLIHGLQHMHIDTHEIIMCGTFYLHSLQTKLHTAVEIDMC